LAAVGEAHRFKDPASLLLAVAMAAAGIFIVVLGSKLTYILDDWVFILYKRDFSADAFLAPDNEHLVAGAVAIWKLMLSGFGMSSTLPYRIVSTAIFLLGDWFLFVWIRRRLGSWPALIAALPVIFLGAAFEDLLWFSSITFLGSLTCGLGMLVALDRRDRTGDRLACVWLIATMLFSSVWVAFAVGAALDIVLRRDRRDWRRRAFLVAVPVALYVLWWLGWGHEAESSITLRNIAATPIFVVDSFAAALASLFGLATPAEGMAAPGGLDWGRPLAVVLGGLAVWRAYRIERIPRSFWVVLAIGLSFWILGGFDVKPGRVPWASRYQLPGVVFVLLAATELLRGVRLGRQLLPVAGVVALAAVTSNLLYLHEAYSSYRSSTEIIRGNLTAMEIARNTVDPGFYLEEEFADTGFDHIDAGSYFSAVDAFGSPAYTISELQKSSEAARFAADKVLLNALRVGVEPIPRSAMPDRRCATVDDSQLFTLPPGGVAIAAGATPVTDIKMTRFATPGENAPLPVDFQAEVGAGEATRIAIPRDLAPTVPWTLRLEGGPATVCALEAG
jgi:hypothetical protein